jgi:hypothetical protein
MAQLIDVAYGPLTRRTFLAIPHHDEKRTFRPTAFPTAAVSIKRESSRYTSPLDERGGTNS